MKQFDYARAWAERAKPGYECLPASVQALFLLVAEEAGSLSQLPDCSMPWPEDRLFRQAFIDIPAEVLAFAARTVHNLGHWKPGKADLPTAELSAIGRGAHWKFSHYADQVLREKLGLPARGDGGRTGVSFAIHEGAIRVCYASRNSWCWEEVAPATARGMVTAGLVAARIRASYADVTGLPHSVKYQGACDSAAYRAFEALRAHPAEPWPADWQRWTLVGGQIEAYMAEPGLAGTPETRLAKLTAKAAALSAEYQARIEALSAKLAIELVGRQWWLTRGIDDDNLIYYDHTGVFCFGWREKIGPAFESAVLDLASEFPYRYQIKCADGRVLDGGLQ